MRARYFALPVALSCFLLARAAAFELSLTDQPPPSEVPAALQGALQGRSIQIQSPKGTLFEFWLVQETTTGGENAGVFGIGFGELKPGSLLGVVKVGHDWLDYKNKPVRPGLYTLRYGIQPADGNHIGVSAFRDFGLLLPLAEDPDPTVIFEYADLVKKASLASGTPHPSVIGLFPLGQEIQGPGLAENEEGQPILTVQIGALGFGLVLEGHGEIEGYR
jgi:hypothetical protein